MNKKVLIACLSALAALAAVITVSVVFLYSGKGKEKDGAAALPQKAEYRLLSAVPSDAAMFMTFSAFSSAVSCTADSTKIFGVLLTDAREARHPFRDMMDSLGKISRKSLPDGPAVVSMHYIRNMAPLLALEIGRAGSDTTDAVRLLISVAQKKGLFTRIADGSALTGEDSPLHKTSVLLVAASETLLTASVRHLESGTSVLEQESLSEAAASAEGHNSLFISHEYIGKLMASDLLRPYSSCGSFFKKTADWTVLSSDVRPGGSLHMTGRMVASDRDQSAVINMFRTAGTGEQKFASAAPAETWFALSLSTPDIAGYVRAYKSCLDANGKLERFNQLAAALGHKAGIDPLRWAESLDIKEIARADVPAGDSLVSVLLLRPAKEDKSIITKGAASASLKDCASPYPNPYAGFVPALLGDIFEVDDSYSLYRDGWLAFGSETSLATLGGGSLESTLSASGAALPAREVSLSAYFGVSGIPSRLGEIFRPAMASGVQATLSGVTDEHATLSLSGDRLTLDVVRASVAPDKKAPVAAVKDTVVYVNAGPFEVINSGTGKKNTLSQAANGTLSLRDEAGKGLWGIPFSGKLCGRVESIDYYNNGKIQFLFASGSRLYLLDRLGRFVKPFPVDLGTEIVLGPAAYDFTGAKGYTVMVLFSDNTIGMYDLHGRIKEGWLGITSGETIKSLPELVETGGRKYWAVRTSARMEFYGFMGGAPLTDWTGNKTIRPDSGITVEDGAVSVTCFDGKVRKVKLKTEK